MGRQPFLSTLLGCRFFPMLIDLHTHTHPLSHDSELSPDQLIEAAKQAGLDGVCLTEHDFFWQHENAADLARRHNFLVIPGIEVNTEDGHVLVFGLERFVFGMHRTAGLARLVEEAGGAMVAAHPYRRQLPFELLHAEQPDAEALSVALGRALANPVYQLAHAIETHNGRGQIMENEFARTVGERTGRPFCAGSDSHQADDVGRCATAFERPIGGLANLITELRAGRVQPVVLREAEPELRKRWQ